jgi:hypothetical protein
MTLCERLADLKQQPRSVAPKELHTLLSDAGFRRRGKRGSTWVYSHPGVEPFTVRDTDPLLPAYVTCGVRVIEQVIDCDADD